jgi:dTDP-4-amino-4,6-dideoxygalactose transaminase
LHAAILLLCLQKIDSWNEKRRELAERYHQKLHNLSVLHVAPAERDRTHIYHLFCVESSRRDEAIKWLTRHQIQSGVYYPCLLHLQEVYSNLSYKPGDFPVTERMSERLLALPMSPFLLEGEQDYIIETLRRFGGE